MLDLYARCSRCGERSPGGARCPRCGKLEASGKVVKRALVWIFAALALVAMVLVAWPQLLPGAAAALRGSRGDEGPASGRKAEPWRFGGVEPASRSWAAPLESSLILACRDSAARAREGRYLSGLLSPRVSAAERAAAPGSSTPARRRLTPEEQRDALSAIGSGDAFLADCLRWSYEAIAPCQHLADRLAGPEAEACLQPPVARALFLGPWKRCAVEAGLPQIRAACAEVAVDLGHWLDRSRPAPVASGTGAGL